MTSIFFFSDTATTEIYTLSLHDALPIWDHRRLPGQHDEARRVVRLVLDVALGDLEAVERRRRLRRESGRGRIAGLGDRKSTRLNSSHANISDAVFCLKKKHVRARRAVLC